MQIHFTQILLQEKCRIRLWSCYQQIWDDPNEPHSSLAVIILDRVNYMKIRTKILKIGKETGLTLDLEQKVSGRYVDRLVRLKQQSAPLTLYNMT